MSNLDYILLKNTNFDKKAVINKFANLIDDILVQFKADGFADAIAGIAKCVPDEAKLGLIDGAIKGKCEILKVTDLLTDGQFNNYVPRILANLTINEQFYVLAHIDLSLLRNKVEEPNLVFANTVYSIIRSRIICK